MKVEHSAGAGMPQNYWHIIKGLKEGEIKPGEWNYFLNYEYARSFRPLVCEVVQRRKQKAQHRQAGTFLEPGQWKYQFSRFLDNYFPEFPATPWMEIDAKDRIGRLESLHVDLVSDPFEPPALRSHDPQIFENDIAIGDLSFRDFSDAARYAILEIDLSRSTREIERLFRLWLKQRKRTEHEWRSKMGHKPRTSQPNAGQAANVRSYENTLKAVGALRLLRHHGWDWKKAFEHSAIPAEGRLDGIGLYTKTQTAWDRPLKKAFDAFMRLEILWRRSFFPGFIFNPGAFTHVVGEKVLSEPLTSSTLKPVNGPSKHLKARAAKFDELKAEILGYEELERLCRASDKAVAASMVSPVKTALVNPPVQSS